MFDILRYFVPFTRYPYEGSARPCPVCGSDRHTRLIALDRRLKRLPTVICDHCGLAYTNPTPSDADIDTYYREYYRFDYQMTTRPTERHVRKRNREAVTRIEAISDILSPTVRSLDFGAGSGEFVEQLAKRGVDAHGFEPSEDFGAYARERLGDRIRIGGYKDIEYDTQFDLITCFHVLEHIRDPLDALEAIKNWLAPGGKVYLEVPDMGTSSVNKGFGGFHFAHLLGFNHFNLQFAAYRVGLRAWRHVTPTGIVFEHGTADDPDRLAAKGAAMAAEKFVERSPVRAYFAYHAGKLSRRRKKLNGDP